MSYLAFQRLQFRGLEAFEQCCKAVLAGRRDDVGRAAGVEEVAEIRGSDKCRTVLLHEVVADLVMCVHVVSYVEGVQCGACIACCSR